MSPKRERQRRITVLPGGGVVENSLCALGATFALQFLLFVTRLQHRVAGVAKHLVLFIGSIETRYLDDFFCQAILRYGVAHEGLEIGVQMAFPGIVQLLRQRGQVVGLVGSRPGDTESGALR